MQQRTAIIDIGSNSVRLVIYEHTNRYAFYLICEKKSQVRIGEGAYNNGGYLQPLGIKRAYLTLQSFQSTIKKYHVDEILCVATSALRDAPNGQAFVDFIAENLNINIHIIDGKTEAKYGAIGAINLLPTTEGITIDIGGGSTDIAIVRHSEVFDTFSLNIGTVRLKELFYDKKAPIEETKAYIAEALEALPERFRHDVAIGMGGTVRTLSKAIIKSSNYPLDKLHAFNYSTQLHLAYLDAIAHASVKDLKKFFIKKHRYDTIREGALIFAELIRHLNISKIVTSTAGIREGIYLQHFFPSETTLKFPPDINPSIASLLSRFKPVIKIEKNQENKLLIGMQLYRTLSIEAGFERQSYLSELLDALKLSIIGNTLTIFKANRHAFYIATQELNYRFTHEQMVLISLLLRTDDANSFPKSLYDDFKILLPDERSFCWLSYMFKLTVILHEAFNCGKISFSFQNKTLTIHADQSLYLVKEMIKNIKKPTSFAVMIDDVSSIPNFDMIETSHSINLP